MTPYIQTIRAVTALLFRRVFKPIIWIVSGLWSLLLFFVIYLAFAISAWWWVALVILIPLGVALAAAVLTLWYLSGRLVPRPLTRGERVQLLGFADKIIRIAEVRATPTPLTVILIAKDVIRGKRSGFVEGIVSDSHSLKDELTNAKEIFTPKTLR